MRLRLLAWLARRFGYRVIVSGLGITISRPMTTKDFIQALENMHAGRSPGGPRLTL